MSNESDIFNDPRNRIKRAQDDLARRVNPSYKSMDQGQLDARVKAEQERAESLAAKGVRIRSNTPAGNEQTRRRQMTLNEKRTPEQVAVRVASLRGMLRGASEAAGLDARDELATLEADKGYRRLTLTAKMNEAAAGNDISEFQKLRDEIKTL